MSGSHHFYYTVNRYAYLQNKLCQCPIAGQVISTVTEEPVAEPETECQCPIAGQVISTQYRMIKP